MSDAADTPPRGFTTAEFEDRCAVLQRGLRAQNLDAALFTMEAEVRYFSGFHSRFWESPTRPWFLLVPLDGKPVAVIPSIGEAGMAATWVEDIRCWSSPDYDDDGVSLLAETMREFSTARRRIGIQLGHESWLRMPVLSFREVVARSAVEIIDITAPLREIRACKSEAEIDKIRHACRIASDGFENLLKTAHAGQSERQICRRLKTDLLDLGADDSPYMIAGSGPGGYDNIIMGPTDRVIGSGDVLIIDTGTTFDGYFCDFDRNYGFGAIAEQVKKAYRVVYAATEAGLSLARPGTTTSGLWRVMQEVLDAGGALGNSTGRSGHFLGMQLTEGPSLMPGDDTVLKTGMVLTLEPGMAFGPGKMMVHEENIVIRDGEAELLSRRTWPELPVIG